MSTIQINIILIYDVNIRSEGIREIQRNHRGEGLFAFLYRARHYTWMLENMLEREKKKMLVHVPNGQTWTIMRNLRLLSVAFEANAIMKREARR